MIKIEKKYVVAVNYKGENIYYTKVVKFLGKKFADFSTLPSKAFHFSNEMVAEVCAMLLKDYGYDAKVEKFEYVAFGI